MTKCEEKLQNLWDTLWVTNGASKTLGGSIVWAMKLLNVQYSVEGERIGIGGGKVTCNDLARFLMANTTEEIANLIIAIWGQENNGAYAALLGVITEKVVAFVESNPNLCLKSVEHPESLPADHLIKEYADPCEDFDEWSGLFDEWNGLPDGCDEDDFYEDDIYPEKHYDLPDENAVYSVDAVKAVKDAIPVICQNCIEDKIHCHTCPARKLRDEAYTYTDV